MSQRKYLSTYKQVKAQMVLVRKDHVNWYRAQVTQNHAQAYERLRTIAAAFNGMEMQLGHFMAEEHLLAASEATFCYDSSEEDNIRLDRARRTHHSNLLNYLISESWSEECVLILKQQLDTHARDELRRRKEMLAFVDYILKAKESIDVLMKPINLQANREMCVRRDSELNNLLTALLAKRTELAVSHCPAP